MQFIGTSKIIQDIMRLHCIRGFHYGKFHDAFTATYLLLFCMQNWRAHSMRAAATKAARTTAP